MPTWHREILCGHQIASSSQIACKLEKSSLKFDMRKELNRRTCESAE
jgi:hypothetical protein